MGGLLEFLTGTVSGLLSNGISIWEYGSPSFFGMVCYLLLFGAWLGSGFFAAMVAEIFNHSVAKHFFLGLLMPYGYPIWLAKHIEARQDEEEAAAAAAEAAEEEARRSELSSRFAEMQAARDSKRHRRIAGQSGVSESEVAAMEAQRNAAAAAEAQARAAAEAAAAAASAAAASPIRDLLYNLPVDEAGNRVGPFQFTLTGGDTVDIDMVKSLSDDFMVCVVSSTGKAVRLKYTNVESVAQYAAQ